MSKYPDLVGESLAAALGVQETLGGEVVGYEVGLTVAPLKMVASPALGVRESMPGLVEKEVISKATCEAGIRALKWPAAMPATSRR